MERLLAQRQTQRIANHQRAKKNVENFVDYTNERRLAELERMTICAKYHMPLDQTFPKFFLKRFGDRLSFSSHTTLEFLAPFSSMVDFCKWRAISNKETWDGEKIDMRVEKLISNLFSIISILGFSGISDKKAVVLPAEGNSLRDLVRSVVSKIGEGIPSAESDALATDHSLKKFIRRLSDYMTTVLNISYQYNPRTRTLLQVIDSRWEIVDGRYVKPTETTYDPLSRAKFRDIHLNTIHSDIKDSVEKLTLDDSFTGANINQPSLSSVEDMTTEALHDPANYGHLAETILNLVRGDNQAPIDDDDLMEAAVDEEFGIVW